MSALDETLVRVLNHLIQSAPWAADRLRPFAGQQLRIEGGPLPFMLAIAADGHMASPDEDNEPAVTITLPSDFPVLLVVDRKKILANARLSGSADFAEALAFVFRNLEWDIEADLANVVGDIAAHRLVRAGRDLHHWQVDAHQRLGENISEYLIEEKRLIATPVDIQEFSGAVATLRDDVARLEKRIRTLEKG